MNIGDRIKALRTERAMPQYVLAKRARVTAGCISQLEGGWRHSPSLPVLRRIAKALHVEITDLLK
jgi:transcriptional regulator with XRE-family HTH domain